MHGFDIQSANEVAARLSGIARRANMFGHDRERLIEEVLFLAEDYAKLAVRIEESMMEEMK